MSAPWDAERAPAGAPPLPPSLMHPNLKRTSREARAVGALLFFPGTYCRNPRAGHLAPRRVSGGQCTACMEAELVKARAAAARKRAKAREKLDAPKTAAREAKAKALEDAREAARSLRRAEKEARARARAAVKAKATREANARRMVAAAAAPVGGELIDVYVPGDAAPWAT